MPTKFSNGGDFGGQRVRSVGTPTASTDAATKGYVDSAASTLFVAANDASTAEKAAAHYLCDGTADNVELQAALDTGRPVTLSAGTFNLAATVTLPNATILTGSGWDSVLKVNNGTNIYALSMSGAASNVGTVLSRFKIDCNGANQTDGGGINALGAVQCLFEFLYVQNAHTAGLRLMGQNGGAFGHHNKVLSCLFDATVTVAGVGRGLFISSSDENLITSEFQYLGGSAANPSHVYDGSGLNTFDACVFVGGRNNARGIRVQDTARTKIVGCTFDGVSGDNVFVTGTKHIIQGNIFTFIGDQGTAPASGVVLEFAVSDVNVLNNFFESSATAGKTQSFVREPADGGGGNNQIVYNGYSITGALGGTAFDLNKAGTIRFGNKGDAVGSAAFIESLVGRVPQTVRLAADVTNNNATANTLEDITGLSFPVVAGGHYKFKIVLYYTIVSAANGMRLTFNGPASPTFVGYETRRYTGGTSAVVSLHSGSYNLPANASGSSASTGPNRTVLEGEIIPSVSGTVQARMASAAASSGLTAKVASYIEWTKIN